MRGDADLQEGGDLGQVGVTEDHVEPAVLLGVGVRLVACVDDWSFEGRLEADLLLEEVRPLGDLERHLDAAQRGSLSANLAGARVDLAGDEVRHDMLHDAGERHLRSMR